MVTGSGILIIELYMGNIVVTLFGLNGTNYNDLGGKIDHNENTQQTAHREAREESMNLINIKDSELMNYATPVMVNSYVVYILYITNLSFQDYAHNVNLVHNNCANRSWKETNSMARIPLNNIINAAHNLSNLVADINGNPIFVKDRAMNIIRTTFNILMNFGKVNPLPLYKHLVTSSRLPCLIGTYTYTIQNGSHYKNNISDLDLTKKYAIYLIPKQKNTINTNQLIHKCGTKLGIPYITITGFSNNKTVEDYIKFIKYISEFGNHPWSININTIKITNKFIYFKSKTLDVIAGFLKDNKFEKIKGPDNFGVKWHITERCKSVNDVKILLKKQSWDIALIEKNTRNKNIKLIDKYVLNIAK
jgi:hypothetical protein